MMHRTQETIDWCDRWGIPMAALRELSAIMIGAPDDPPTDTGVSEAAISARLRVEASRQGWRLWRNNVGAAQTDTGSYVRFGLANDSAQINARIKSGDLIGIKPGGQFVSREVKAAGWKYTGTPREVAQLRWIETITALGGDAKFSTGAL